MPQQHLNVVPCALQWHSRTTVTYLPCHTVWRVQIIDEPKTETKWRRRKNRLHFRVLRIRETVHWLCGERVELTGARWMNTGPKWEFPTSKRHIKVFPIAPAFTHTKNNLMARISCILHPCQYGIEFPRRIEENRFLYDLCVVLVSVCGDSFDMMTLAASWRRQLLHVLRNILDADCRHSAVSTRHWNGYTCQRLYSQRAPAIRGEKLIHIRSFFFLFSLFLPSTARHDDDWIPWHFNKWWIACCHTFAGKNQTFCFCSFIFPPIHFYIAHSINCNLSNRHPHV